MEENSVKFTSFVTQLGHFEYVRMPFGLTNAPSVFVRYINDIFYDLIRDKKVIIYMDDILIATETVEEHLSILAEILKRLNDNFLNLRFDKCTFMQNEVT